MTKKIKKVWLIIAVLSSVLLLTITIIVSLWFLLPPNSGYKLFVMERFPIPLVRVNGSTIYTKQFYERVNSAKAFYKGTKKLEPIEDLIYSKLVYEEKVKQLANTYKIKVTGLEVESEFSRIKSSYKIESNISFENYLKSSGLTEDGFKKQVVFPGLLKQHLLIWFNSNENLNQKGFEKANAVKKLLSEGSSFEEVSKTFNEDLLANKLDGTLGFIELNNLLPELKQGLENLPNGELKILPSRMGIHVVKVVSREKNSPSGSDRIELQGIFIKLEDFELWFNNSTKNFAVHMFINYK